MKIALLYSGNLRSFESCSTCHLNLIEILKKCYDIKIFSHSWSFRESTSGTWWKKDDDKDNTCNADDVEKIIYKTLKTDRILVTNNLNLDTPNLKNYNSLISIEGLYSMVLSISKSFEIMREYMIENDWQPDIVIKLRYDIIFNHCDIVTAVANIKQKKILNRYFAYSSNSYFLTGSVSDVLFVFPLSVADAYFNNINMMFSEKKLELYNQKYTTFIPEIFITKYVLSKYKPYVIDGSLHILRLSLEKIEISCNNELPEIDLICFIKKNVIKRKINISLKDFQNKNILAVKLIINNTRLFHMSFIKKFILFFLKNNSTYYVSLINKLLQLK